MTMNGNTKYDSKPSGINRYYCQLHKSVLLRPIRKQVFNVQQADVWECPVCGTEYYSLISSQVCSRYLGKTTSYEEACSVALKEEG